jgi:hypothetical protein
VTGDHVMKCSTVLKLCCEKQAGRVEEIAGLLTSVITYAQIKQMYMLQFLE